MNIEHFPGFYMSQYGDDILLTSSELKLHIVIKETSNRAECKVFMIEPHQMVDITNVITHLFYNSSYDTVYLNAFSGTGGPMPSELPKLIDPKSDQRRELNTLLNIIKNIEMADEPRKESEEDG